VIPYEQFRTGLTYRDVYQLLWSWSDDRRTWRHKRRRTVLGYWRQLKREMYAHYENAAHAEREQEAA
jgi:hypothetical protein